MADEVNPLLVSFLQQSDESDESDSNSSLDSWAEYDSSDEEPVVETYEQDLESRNTIKNFVEEIVPTYSDKEFVTHFRIGRCLMASLVDQFTESPVYQTLLTLDNSRASISPSKHMHAFLWFAGHQGGSFPDIADRFDVSISSLHSITMRVVEFLCLMAPNIIRWPTQDEKNATKAFYGAKGFPGAIGSIDGSHIKIDKPKKRGDDYINRHNYASIILQGICNEKKKFIDIFLGYPGSVHDARVFKKSPVYRNLEQLCEGGYLLGDSAYPNLSVLLTPYRDNGHLDRSQKNFNTKLSQCRIDIENTFGILKQRFRQLYHLKIRGHTRQCKFIKALCTLHNIADEEDLLNFGAEVNELNEQPGPNPPAEDPGDAHPNGNNLRDGLCQQLFNQGN